MARKHFQKGDVRWWTSLVWPVTGLVLLLLFNLVFTEGFFRVEIRDGRLYGVLIDILNHGSKVMLLALGMALVIATSGVDLSVGAVMAIAGAVAAQLINIDGVPFPVVVAASLGVALLAGAWNGLLVGAFNVQPIVATLILMVAGRGVRSIDYRRPDYYFHRSPPHLCGQRKLSRFPVSCLAQPGNARNYDRPHPQVCNPLVHRSGRRQSESQRLRGRERCDRQVFCLRLLWFLRGPRGAGSGVQYQVRGRKSRRPFP